jgi:hypothetical protein
VFLRDTPQREFIWVVTVKATIQAQNLFFYDVISDLVFQDFLLKMKELFSFSSNSNCKT